MQIGGGATRYIALDSGSIQATMLVPPLNKVAREKGFNELLYFNDMMRVPLSGLSVHVEKSRKTPTRSSGSSGRYQQHRYIRANKAEF